MDTIELNVLTLFWVIRINTRVWIPKQRLQLVIRRRIGPLSFNGHLEPLDSLKLM